jgi:hypothetical protein
MDSRDSTALDTGPAAFNPQRLHWADLPEDVQALIAQRAGAPVVAATSVTQGFSPGFAGIVSLADGGRLFIKAVSAHPNAEARDLATAEVLACQALTPEVPAPRLLWSQLDEWAVLAFEVIDGESPALPWTPAALEAALDAVGRLASCTPSPGSALQPIATKHADLFDNWAAYAARSGAEREERLKTLGAYGPWVEQHLDALVEWESQGPAATAGDRLAHCDLRADNMVVGGDTMWLVDWPHAALAAPWLDLVGLLPSVQMQGGGAAHHLFSQHPLSHGVDRDHLRAAVAALAGFFVVGALEPPPPSIPTLRAFQWGQGIAALDWLKALDPALTDLP